MQEKTLTEMKKKTKTSETKLRNFTFKNKKATTKNSSYWNAVTGAMDLKVKKYHCNINFYKHKLNVITGHWKPRQVHDHQH